MEQTPFDRLVSSQELQMLKLIIPYTPPANQHLFAMYVKFMELRHTFSVFHPFSKNIHAQEFQKEISSPLEILNDLRPYLPTKNMESLDMILNMMSMAEMFSSDSGNMPDMSDLFSTMFTAQGNTDFSETCEMKTNENSSFTDEMKGNDNYEHGSIFETPLTKEDGSREIGTVQDSSFTDQRQEWQYTGSSAYEPDYFRESKRNSI